MKQIAISTNVVSEQEIPKELIVDKVNNALIAQAVRVYRAALRQGNAHTKDRGEVAGSTRKIYKQKGTGRARHGSIKAPVFVGGGTVFGPRAHDFDLDMPVKMRRQATIHALNKRIGHLAGVIVDVAEAKTKDVRVSLKKLLEDEKVTLLVLADEAVALRKAVANLPHVRTISAGDLNAFEVMKHAHVVVDQKAWKVLADRLVKKSGTK